MRARTCCTFMPKSAMLHKRMRRVGRHGTRGHHCALGHELRVGLVQGHEARPRKRVERADVTHASACIPGTGSSRPLCQSRSSRLPCARHCLSFSTTNITPPNPQHHTLVHNGGNNRMQRALARLQRVRASRSELKAVGRCYVGVDEGSKCLTRCHDSARRNQGLQQKGLRQKDECAGATMMARGCGMDLVQRGPCRSRCSCFE